MEHHMAGPLRVIGEHGQQGGFANSCRAGKYHTTGGEVLTAPPPIFLPPHQDRPLSHNASFSFRMADTPQLTLDDQSTRDS